MTAVTIPTTGANWVTYGSLLYQMARPESNVVLRKNGSNFEAWCQDPAHGRISTSSDQETAWQAGYDHVSNHEGSTGHKGGELLMLVDDFPIDTQLILRPTTVGGGDGSSTVWPVRVRGTGLLPRKGALTGPPGGTRIRWNSGSPPGGSGMTTGAMVVGLDAHGCEVTELSIDGNSIARRCGMSAARAFRWNRVQFRYPYPQGFAGAGATAPTSNDQTIGIGCLITNGADETSDSYVQPRIIDCDFIGNDGGVGIVVRDLGAGGSPCTDGRIYDTQMNGMNDGDCYVGQGGWGVSRGHWTMNNSGGDRKWGFWSDAGFMHWSDIYIDIVGLGPNIKITNSGFTLTGGFLIANGKVTNNTYPLIDVGSNNGMISGVLWGGTTARASYAIAGTSGAQLAGNIGGPSGSWQTAAKQQSWPNLTVNSW
jgi:hypothetical protein